VQVDTPDASVTEQAPYTFVDPVSVAVNVGVTPGTGLLLASCSVIVTLDVAEPSATTGLVPVIVEFPAVGTPGFTVNGLLVPDLPDAVAVIVLPVPACVTVTLSVRTPAVNAPEVMGEIVPAVVERLAVVVKLVTVLLNASNAVMRMLKAVPAVWVLMFPPAPASTTK
jgi:hypothetical protein